MQAADVGAALFVLSDGGPRDRLEACWELFDRPLPALKPRDPNLETAESEAARRKPK